ncbi:papain family cysteine protease [Pelomyxa schiedti]|nr:papain family cysteine protease [Pelomyxa schiedti]
MPSLCSNNAIFMKADFDRFLVKYGKQYTGEEYLYRMKVYHANIRKANALNGNGDAVFGETKFSDLTDEEFNSRYLMAPTASEYLATSCLIAPDYEPKPAATALRDVPATFDWRNTAGVVSPVQDQGSCGSCWAFSTIEAIEGAYGVWKQADWSKAGLSPQMVVDCSLGQTSEIYQGTNTTVKNTGCGGGWPWTAFDDISNQKSPTYIGGVPLASDYPYTGVTGTCKMPSASVYGISSYTCVSDHTSQKGADETVMQQTLMTQGPLSIALNANYFSLYTGGIFKYSGCTGTYLNHAVLIVGWGTDTTDNTPYWIIKNSWGPSWGESGYIRMLRGSGLCGLNQAVSYPVI